MYQRINGSAWRHILLMGDLHGCFNLLMSRLKELDFNPYEDLLLSVGDLIDRGPNSLKCLSLIEQKWFIAIRRELRLKLRAHFLRKTYHHTCMAGPERPDCQA